MDTYLSAENAPKKMTANQEYIKTGLQSILLDIKQSGDILSLIASYYSVLSDNRQQSQWDAIHKKLEIIFQCGQASVLDGPMIGISLSIRDSELCPHLAQQQPDTNHHTHILASIWNLTFASTGLWMGKTFEAVDKEYVAQVTWSSAKQQAAYESHEMRVGRNYFREVVNPNPITGLGLPVLTNYWRLRDRPSLEHPNIFNTRLTPENAQKEQAIPYQKTGGIFLSAMGYSVLPHLASKKVYQLNYRWPNLQPAFPMNLLIDELVQIDDGLYLGQLIMATRHPQFQGDGPMMDYGYQNNGFFLMVDTRLAKRLFAEKAFAHLRPRPGEAGYDTPSSPANPVQDWQNDPLLRQKFTTFIMEKSPNPDDDWQAVHNERKPHESVLMMLQRISNDISQQTLYEDHLHHFAKLHRLFRCGIAPKVQNGRFAPAGEKNNSLLQGGQNQLWDGHPDPINNYDFYHGATLNLHWGFRDSFSEQSIFSSMMEHKNLTENMAQQFIHGSNLDLNLPDATWKAIGKYIFPWAGKSFATISGRKLSQLVDESPDLASRYPMRVQQLKTHMASLPHYDLVQKNAAGFFPHAGRFAPYLEHGPWDNGMTDEQKQFWQDAAANNWLYGANLQDERILIADPIFRLLDMNYGPLDPIIANAGKKSVSPFVRQGYIFLGLSDQPSILPINNGQQNKQVFQFHYRYPMIGGPFPIGLCLDEIVEIAQGLFLGQLIYATALQVPFHSATPAEEYKYQLFGYFLLLDEAWEQHRQAIGLDVWQ